LLRYPALIVHFLKSLWMKVTAKLININVTINVKCNSMWNCVVNVASLKDLQLEWELMSHILPLLKISNKNTKD